MSRRMVGLFAVALVLIAWRVSRVEPLQRPAFESVVREGEQLFPIAVPPVEERFLVEVPASRLERLRALSVAPAHAGTASEGPGTCELFVRISRNHWRRHVLDPLGSERLGVQATGDGQSTSLASLSATDAVDDDDGDGERLDLGELRPATEPGVEVEIYCSASTLPERESER